MARIDTTEVILDMDFTDSFELIRRSESVNEWGELVVVESSEMVMGVVQNATAETVNALPQGANLGDYIKVWYVGDMQADNDVVVFNGRRYRVETVERWGNWGTGFVSALCRMESVNGEY